VTPADRPSVAPAGGAGHDEVLVVVPVAQGEGLVVEAHRQISAALEGAGERFVLALVDDGSIDGTWAAIERLVDADPRVVGVRLGANVGQAPAIAAGIRACHRGHEPVLTTDVDLETDPADLLLLLDAVRAGHAVASGRRTTTRRWSREAPSRAFNRYARLRGLGLHDVGCGSNAWSAEVAAWYGALPDLRRELPTAVVAAVEPRPVEVALRSRRPSSSQLRPWHLVALWLSFEARRPISTPVVAAGAAGAAAVAGLGPGPRPVRLTLGAALLVPASVRLAARISASRRPPVRPPVVAVRGATERA
jgi:hypothetical protein